MRPPKSAAASGHGLTAPGPAECDLIVPVCNEADSIDEFYARVARIGYAGSLLFIDNASTDGTPERIAALPSARLVRHATNEGYGGSIRDGIARSDRLLIIVIDADLEYPPEAIPEMVRALDREAVVYASRFLVGPPPAMPLLRRLGNRLVTAAFNLLFRQQTTDLYTGMKGFRREAVAGLSLTRSGFEHVVELSTAFARRGHRIAEMPVEYTPRARGTSKMRHVPEMLKYVWFLVRYRIGP